MDPNADNASKAFEATPHKLNEARKKGELARSADLNTSASYAGLLAALVLAGAATVDRVGTDMAIMLDQAIPISGQMLGGSGLGHASSILQNLISGLMIWFLLPVGFVLLSAFAQRSIVFAPSKIAPKLSRISLLQNAKNKFGPSGLFEFSKNFVKLLLFSVLLAIYLSFRMPMMTGTLHVPPAVAAHLLSRVLIEFLCIVVVISASVGVVDYMWQYFDHLRRNRMTHKEVKDESKEQEGDPTLKQERRHRGTQLTQHQVTSAVATADVVIVNPTHYAVALKWSRDPGSAPACVAKGVDFIAQTIKSAAVEHNVPIRSDPPTARALYASTEIGQEIDQKHYRAVAAAIRFAETVQKRAAYWS